MTNPCGKSCESCIARIKTFCPECQRKCENKECTVPNCLSIKGFDSCSDCSEQDICTKRTKYDTIEKKFRQRYRKTKKLPS